MGFSYRAYRFPGGVSAYLLIRLSGFLSAHIHPQQSETRTLNTPPPNNFGAIGIFAKSDNFHPNFRQPSTSTTTTNNPSPTLTSSSFLFKNQQQWPRFRKSPLDFPYTELLRREDFGLWRKRREAMVEGRKIQGNEDGGFRETPFSAGKEPVIHGERIRPFEMAFSRREKSVWGIFGNRFGITEQTSCDTTQEILLTSSLFRRGAPGGKLKMSLGLPVYVPTIPMPIGGAADAESECRHPAPPYLASSMSTNGGTAVLS